MLNPPQTNTSRMQLPSNGVGRFLSARAWAIATASNQLAKRHLTCSIVIGCTAEQIRKFSIPSATESRRQKWRVTVENCPKVSRISGKLLPISIHNVRHVEMASQWHWLHQPGLWLTQYKSARLDRTFDQPWTSI
jgi:hypothetical protein